MAWGSSCCRKWFVCSRAVKLLPSAEANAEISQDPSEKKHHLPLGFDIAGSAVRPRSSVALWPSCYIFFVLSISSERKINGVQGGLSTQWSVLP